MLVELVLVALADLIQAFSIGVLLLLSLIPPTTVRPRELVILQLTWSLAPHSLLFVVSLDMDVEAGSLNEAALTELALIRFLACVEPLVVDQSSPLTEALATPATDLRLLACVSPLVLLQLGLGVGFVVTELAAILPHLLLVQHILVVFHLGLVFQHFPTVSAHDLLVDLGVLHIQVVLQTFSSHEGLGADVTNVISFFPVDTTHVLELVSVVPEIFVAVVVVTTDGGDGLPLPPLAQHPLLLQLRPVDLQHVLLGQLLQGEDLGALETGPTSRNLLRLLD